MDDSLGKMSLGPSREKYWEERNADEKLDVVKDVILQLQKALESNQRSVNRLECHCHGTDGRMLLDYNRNSIGSEASGWGYGFKRLLNKRERGD